MDIRKSAVGLANEERDKFLEALIRLKQRPAPNLPAGLTFSVYDQFVLLHGAVMAVLPPAGPPPVNMAHWNIGFCPWHRQYLRSFETALQNEVAGVTLPYWDWAAHPDAEALLFTDGFLGKLNSGPPSDVTGGVLRNPVPAADRPVWWPAGASGWPIALPEDWGASLERGTVGVSWPPSESQIEALEQLDMRGTGLHHFWYFWIALEGGAPGVSLSGPLASLASRTHNTAHNFIGGHMGGNFSPNDPIFWLHHANVDRLWHRWQQFQLDTNGGTHGDHYPPAADTIPWNGNDLPSGHGIDDPLWPWVGMTPGYDTPGLNDLGKQLLPDFTADPLVRVSDVLDSAAMDYGYL